jgi:hypothetical protein
MAPIRLEQGQHPERRDQIPPAPAPGAPPGGSSPKLRFGTQLSDVRFSEHSPAARMPLPERALLAMS